VATVVVGDDQVVFLEALSDVIEQNGHTVAGVARDTAQMLVLVARERPDLCLIERHRAKADDGDTIAAVRMACERTSVVIIGADRGEAGPRRALDAGASGYIHLSRGVNVLVSALERMLGGEIVVDVPDAQPGPRGPVSPAGQLASRLTSRERECLTLLVAGLDTTAIAEILGVSRTTVRSHMHAVLSKLGVHSRLEAASFAVRHGLAAELPVASSLSAGCMRPVRALRAVAGSSPVHASYPGRGGPGLPSPSIRRRAAGGRLPRTGDR